MKKNILIFGSGGDLGFGITTFMLRKKYDRYFLFNRDISKIPNYQSDLITRVAIKDLSVEENVKSAFEQVPLEKQSTYFLISTIGGYFGGKSIIDTEYSDWLSQMNLNLNSQFLISKYFMKLIRQTAGGSICFISAFTGLYPEANKAAYGVSKNALNYLTRILALEGKEPGFTANAIAPYIINTPKNREWVKDTNLMVSPNEIAGLIHSFLIIISSFQVI